MGTQTVAPKLETKNDKGEYPLCNCSYDLIAMLYKKSKALEAYEAFSRDFSDNGELVQMMDSFRKDEVRHIEELKGHLAGLLNKAK